jgi:parallel beta-helix repeat protein
MKSEAIVMVLLVLFSLTSVISVKLFNVGLANPSSMIPPPPPLPRIYVREDGTLEPSNVPIQRAGNVYTLTASLGERVIEVQRDNVVIDGIGFSMAGKTYENGVILSGRQNVVVKNLVLKTFSAGIFISNCTGCSFEHNLVTNSSNGISILSHSKNNVIDGNTLRENMGGIYIFSSSSNTLRNNVMENNKYNFNLYLGNSWERNPILQSDLVNDVDFSNLADGKPVCYWTNQQDKTVPAGCGCVFLIDCKNIVVQNLALSRNGYGVMLFATAGARISNNTITCNGYGVWADRTSTHITIEKNDISANTDDGISLVGLGGNLIANNRIMDNRKLGIRLEDSEGNRVTGNTVAKNYYGGIGLENISQTTVAENLIIEHKDNSRSAISLGLTLDSTISSNTIENNGIGLEIHDLSKNNIIAGNTIRNNQDGIHFYYTTMYGPYNYPTSTNTFRDNHLDQNEAPLRFESSFIQDIDTSNVVNGKPIYYWIEQRGRTVPSDAGYIALINCDSITVENVDISYNKDGIMLFGTNNSLITKNTFSDNSEHGIYIWHSTNNVFSANQVFTNGWDGIFIEDSSSNIFVQNHVVNNLRCGMEVCADNCSILTNNVTSNGDAGIKLNGAKNNTIQDNYVAGNEPGILLIWGTSQCNVIGNTLTENNKWGMRIEGSEIDAIIHHNNFINNKVNQSLQISIPWPADPNVWDDGKEGNYWSDYTVRYPNASEIRSSGIGDMSFFINENNIDHFPLMKPIGFPDFSLSHQPTESAPDENSTIPNQSDASYAGREMQNEQLFTISIVGVICLVVASAVFFGRKKFA